MSIIQKSKITTKLRKREFFIYKSDYLLFFKENKQLTVSKNYIFGLTVNKMCGRFVQVIKIKKRLPFGDSLS